MTMLLHPITPEVMEIGRRMGGDNGVLVAALQWRLCHEFPAESAEQAVERMKRRGWIVESQMGVLSVLRDRSRRFMVTDAGRAAATEVLPC